MKKNLIQSSASESPNYVLSNISNYKPHIDNSVQEILNKIVMANISNFIIKVNLFVFIYRN